MSRLATALVKSLPKLRKVLVNTTYVLAIFICFSTSVFAEPLTQEQYNAITNGSGTPWYDPTFNSCRSDIDPNTGSPVIVIDPGHSGNDIKSTDVATNVSISVKARNVIGKVFLIDRVSVEQRLIAR